MRALSINLGFSVLLATACPAWAQAQTLVQDRYGPPPAQSLNTALAEPPAMAHAGPFLGWPGKTTAVARPARSEAPERPEPLALARQFMPQPATAAPPVAQPRATPPPREVGMFQPGSEPVLRGATLAPAASSADGLLGGPPQASIYDSPAPRQMAAAPQAAAPPAPRTGGAGAGGQLYSLHREYGLTPDAIPAPAGGPNYILVGPPDAPEAGGDEAADEGLDRDF